MNSLFILAGILLFIVATADCRAGGGAPSSACATQQGAIAVESAPSPMPVTASSAGPVIDALPAKVSPASVRKTAVVAPGQGKQGSLLPLDLAALEKRLRETNAIGFFAKITLKNQVDDLVSQFRDHHGKPGKISVAQLRQRYDMLLLKVLSLLQDSDPPLARTIVASRDSLWGMLADPAQFKTI